MTEITADLAREFEAPDRITALVRTADSERVLALLAQAEAALAGTDLSIPEYAGPGIGMSDTCGLCRQRFDLMAEPDQYPTLPNDMGDPEELICDACQDLMEAGRDETGTA